MGELHLKDKKQRREYGNRYEGWVETDKGNVGVTLRQPFHANRSRETAYAMASGLGGPKVSMRLPAHKAVEAGYTSITFEYSNKVWTREALTRNAHDLSAIIIALANEGYTQRVLGLSMGGRVAVKSLVEVGSLVESSTLVAPAGLLYRDPTKGEVVKHFTATAPEVARLATKSLARTLYLGAKTLHHGITRGPAMAAELCELIQGNEHNTLIDIKRNNYAPRIHLMYGSDDRLMPPWAFEMSIDGLPFDHIEAYRGGHMALVDDPKIAQRVFEIDHGFTDKTVSLPLARAS